MRRVFAGILLLLVLAAGGAWWWARAAVPALDGEWRLAGLGGPVEVLSDAHGAPHVYARDAADAWFVAGALHARDRLWQMELYRRAAYGRLSEVLGEATLPIDKRMLTLGIRRAAEAELARLGPTSAAALRRYAEGVNAAAATLRGRLRPLEFQALGITPAEWTARDSLVIGRLLAFRLAENHGAELVRHALARAVGLVAADRLAGAYPEGGPTVLGELAEFLASPPTGAAPPPAPAVATPLASNPRRATPVAYPPGLAWLDPTAPRANSNAWVVAGSRTATGRPLLANDPHLLIELPSVWYELHLVAAGLDVQGVTVPGTPYVAIGHNDRVAWGFTNTGADVQDFSVETFDLGTRRVLGPTGWRPVQVESVPIPVKGRTTPVPFEIWRTGNGVVFADESLDWEAPPAWLAPDEPRQGVQRALVLRWAGFDGAYAEAFQALNLAGSWTEFQAAVDRLSAISQNAVYADVEGNIGYVMSGLLPQRTSGDGSRPTRAGWSGSVGGPGVLPRAFNPARGFLATSNNPIVRSSSPHITRDWVAPYRAARVLEVLASETAVDVASASALQLDVASGAAAHVLKGLDGALARAKRDDAPAGAGELLAQLRGWNRHIDGTETAATYEAFEDRLWRRTFADEFAEPLFRRFYQWAGAERAAGLYTILDQPDARWWDDIGTVDRKETRDDIFLLAASDVAADLAARPSGARTWDRVHTATFSHPLSGGGRLLAWLFNRGPVPVVGDGTTVMRISHRRLGGFGAWEHPSWRQVLDVGGWDNSRVVLPAGQSGHPLSPHYFDQNELWRQGQYRQSPFSRAAVTAAAVHRQLLTP